MKTVILIVSLFWLTNLHSQPNEYSRQLFGTNCYLRFPTGINVFGSQLVTSEGCASISDASGNLLFYTDGIKVWNSSHIQMTNGFGLNGNASASQACIIVKKPLSNTLYYIITVTEASNTNSTAYSIVYMSIGDVVIKNQNIFNLNIVGTEKLTFTYHCNGVDIWIITKDRANDLYRAWLLTSAGFNAWMFSLTPYTLTTTLQDNIGCMKVSPNGRKLAVCHYGSNRVYLYNFNINTGIINNELLLSSTFVGPYGCEFSSNSQYLYVGYNSGANIHRYDVLGTTPATTRISIASSVGIFTGTFQRIGNIIYIAQQNTNFLDAITNIDNGGVFNQDYLPVTGTVRFGLNQVLYPINQQLPIITTN